MDFTTSQCENTVTRMYGKPSPTSSTSSHSPPSSKTASSHCTEVSRPPWTHSTLSDNSKEYRKSLKKDPCATSSGLIPTKSMDGDTRPEVPDTSSDKKSPANSTTATDSPKSQEHTNLRSTDITKLTKEMLLPSFLHPTTATDVEMKQPSWKSMKISDAPTYASTPRPNKNSTPSKKKEFQTTSSEEIDLLSKFLF